MGRESGLFAFQTWCPQGAHHNGWWLLATLKRLSKNGGGCSMLGRGEQCFLSRSYAFATRSLRLRSVARIVRSPPKVEAARSNYVGCPCRTNITNMYAVYIPPKPPVAAPLHRRVWSRARKLSRQRCGSSWAAEAALLLFVWANLPKAVSDPESIAPCLPDIGSRLRR